MSDLFHLALRHIPSAMRSDATSVALLLERGYRAGEVAEQLGVSTRRVREMRSRLRDGMVNALAEDGYSMAESIRYLGVPTAMVMAGRNTDRAAP
jgi:hypothetical protein